MFNYQNILIGLNWWTENQVFKSRESPTSSKNNKIRVMVGMSGGVDSSVAAALLKKQGYQVIGIFLKFWKPTLKTTNNSTKHHRQFENVCCSQEALCQARQVAQKLKIPFYVLDASQIFKKEVVDYYIKEYDSGRTPNPCVVCNKKIKFGWLLEQARKLGCDLVASGHYARVVREIPNFKSQIPNKFEIRNSKFETNHKSKIINHKLLKAKDKKKDQSYFLWQLDQEQLAHILFPIGNYSKDEVRRMARQWGLPTAEKKESQDLCFLDTDQADFLADYAEKLNKPGKMVDLEGNVVGQHRGLCFYTVGQRQGLGVQIPNNKFQITNKFKISNSKQGEILRPSGAQNDNQSTNQPINKAGFQPAYVVRLDVKKNQLVVGSKDDLYLRNLVAEKVNWMRSCNMQHVTCNKKIKNQKSKIKNLTAKIRYGAEPANCQIKLLNCQTVKLSNSQNDNLAMKQFSNFAVQFMKPQRAVTPGQSIVFYNKQEIIGGGIIL